MVLKRIHLAYCDLFLETSGLGGDHTITIVLKLWSASLLNHASATKYESLILMNFLVVNNTN